MSIFDARAEGVFSVTVISMARSFSSVGVANAGAFDGAAATRGADGGETTISQARHKEALSSIGASAHASATGMTDTELISLIESSSSTWDGITTITLYVGGKRETRDGSLLSLPWGRFGAELLDCAQDVVPKGSGVWFTPAITTNGRCRDVDVTAITQLSLDADGVGDWHRLRRVLEGAGVAYILQRSSSHSAEHVKWHAHIPVATPWTGDKSGWRRMYRHLVGWWSAAGGLGHDLAASPPVYGFDHRVDRLGQPWFGSARRSEEMPVPEMICAEGLALDLARFSHATAFDPGNAEAACFAQRPVPSKRKRKRRSTPARAFTATPDSASEGLLVMAFREAGMLGPPSGPNKYSVTCPWGSRHTTGEAYDSSTVVFLPSPGRTLGWFHCSHSHCEGKKPRDVLAVLPSTALSRALTLMQQRATTNSGVVPRFVPNRIEACGLGVAVRGRE